MHFAVSNVYGRLIDILMRIAKLEGRLILLKNPESKTAYDMSHGAARVVLNAWLQESEVISFDKASGMITEMKFEGLREEIREVERRLFFHLRDVAQRADADYEELSGRANQLERGISSMTNTVGDLRMYIKEVVKLIKLPAYGFYKDKIRGIALSASQRGRPTSEGKLLHFYDSLLAKIVSKAEAAVTLAGGTILPMPSWKRKAVELYFKLLNPLLSLGTAPAPGAGFAMPVEAVFSEGAERVTQRALGKQETSSTNDWTITYSVDPEARFEANAKAAFLFVVLLQNVITSIEDEKIKDLSKDIAGDLWYFFEKLNESNISEMSLADLAFAVIVQQRARILPQVGLLRSGDHKVYQGMRTIDVLSHPRIVVTDRVYELPGISKSVDLHLPDERVARAYMAFLAVYHKKFAQDWQEVNV